MGLGPLHSSSLWNGSVTSVLSFDRLTNARLEIAESCQSRTAFMKGIVIIALFTDNYRGIDRRVSKRLLTPTGIGYSGKSPW